MKDFFELRESLSESTEIQSKQSSVEEASYKVPKNYAAMMAKKRKKAGTSDKKKEAETVETPKAKLAGFKEG